MKRFGFLLVLILGMFSLSGCYLWSSVGTNQMGAQLDGNRIVTVVGPGVYSDIRLFAGLKTVDVDTQTFSVEDPEVLTNDNQIVGLKITIQARRKADTPSVINTMTNWANMLNNEALVATISATAREGLKNGVRGFDLAGLLNDRNGLAEAIKSQLKEDTSQYSVDIINVTIENIALNPDYAATLNQKSLVKAQTEKAIQERVLIEQTGSNMQLQAQQDTKALEERLKKEQAQTAVDVEIASRKGEVTAEENKVYMLNPQAFALKQMEYMRDTINKATLVIVPQGTDLNTLFMSNDIKGVVPVTPPTTTTP